MIRMLNSLASYLLGYPGPSSGAAGEAEAAVSAHVPLGAADVRLSAVEADDDWLLVDKTDEDDCLEGATASSPAVPAATAARLTLAVSTTSYRWPDSDDATAASAAAALGGGLGAGPLEESWFVTPPPCFTSGSVPLETSPLENLLIEHPSMSVYHRSPASPASPATSSATPLSNSVGASHPPRAPQAAQGAPAAQGRTNLRKLNRANASSSKQATAAAAAAETSAPPRTASAAASPTAASPSAGRGATATAASPAQATPAAVQPQGGQGAAQAAAQARRPNAYSPYHQQQQQVLQYRTAQKLVQRAACQQLKRDSMERTNKAREIRSSRNKRQRRSDHMNRHSGANNNRKC